MEPYTVNITDSIEDIRPYCLANIADWSTRPFQHPDYLKVLETLLPKQGIKPFYALAFSGKQPIGVLYFQQYFLSIPDVLPLTTNLKAFCSRYLNIPLIPIVVCGNLLATGGSGVMVFDNIGQTRLGSLINITIDAAQSQKMIKNGMILIKDLDPAWACDQDFLDNGFKRLSLAPSMRLSIPENWHNLTDYLDSLKSKYRTAAVKIRDNAVSITRRSLDLEALIQWNDNIEALYNAVYQRAKARGPYLGSRFFRLLAENLPADQFEIIGYFKGSSLVAFNTRFFYQKTLESTFFGINPEANAHYQLFKNMLLDDLECAITRKVESLHLGRTSYDIKSALGAVPIDLRCYYRPLTRLYTPFGKYLESVVRLKNWKPRHPYRHPPAASHP